MDERLIPLSALQHYVFCPRQCSLIHSEQVWADNYLTAQGNQLHERVDHGAPETRKNIRFERGINVAAPQLGITGKLDLLEFHIKDHIYIPVEYKRGRPKKDDSDRVQLCAQALCIEEMTNQEVATGSLWYWQTRKRVDIEINEPLRQTTLNIIQEVKQLFNRGITPKPILTKACDACSLNNLCFPTLFSQDKSTKYLKELYCMDSDE